MTHGVVLTVGNSLMGDDGAGPLLARRLARTPAPGWTVIDGGTAPENEVQRVRALEPDRVLVVDAADMGLHPGAVRLVADELIGQRAIMTTHQLPLTFLLRLLRDSVAEVRLLAIQPVRVAFASPVSMAVRQAVRRIHQGLTHGVRLDTYQRL